jgi:hypothetical protein|tara:strand:+ start:1211 stop:1480 length:270 start_codon:yes stop_codon:yes gene_type:complete
MTDSGSFSIELAITWRRSERSRSSLKSVLALGGRASDSGTVESARWERQQMMGTDPDTVRPARGDSSEGRDRQARSMRYYGGGLGTVGP